MVKILFKHAAIIGACLLFSACSSVKEYSGTSNNNFTFEAELNERDQVRADIAIDEVDTQCNQTFAGYLLDLGSEPVTIGIPENSRVVLYFEFRGTGRTNRSSMGIMEAFFTVKKNHQYEVRAVYSENIFDGIIKETNMQSGKSRMIRPESASTCKVI